MRETERDRQRERKREKHGAPRNCARGRVHSYSVSSFVHLTNIHAMHAEGAEVYKEITCPQWNWGLGVVLGIRYRDWGYSSSVEHVLSMLEGLGSTHSTTN